MDFCYDRCRRNGPYFLVAFDDGLLGKIKVLDELITVNQDHAVFIFQF